MKALGDTAAINVVVTSAIIGPLMLCGVEVAALDGATMCSSWDRDVRCQHVKQLHPGLRIVGEYTGLAP